MNAPSNRSCSITVHTHQLSLQPLFVLMYLMLCWLEPKQLQIEEKGWEVEEREEENQPQGLSNLFIQGLPTAKQMAVTLTWVIQTYKNRIKTENGKSSLCSGRLLLAHWNP